MKNPYYEYRKENFKIEASLEENDIVGITEVILSISHNGRQFVTMSFTEAEWKKIKKAVEEQFKSLKS